MKRWIGVLVLCFLLVGCGDDNKSPMDTKAKMNPLAEDVELETAKGVVGWGVEDVVIKDGLVDGGREAEVLPFANAGGYGYANKFTMRNTGNANGGRQAWRLPGPRAKYGRTAVVVFSSGKTFRVAAQYANRIKSGPNNGFVWKSTGTHGGPFVHAPYKDMSPFLTVYY